MLTKAELYSYRHSTNPKLNRMAVRSLIGSLATLTTSVADLTVLMMLRGEPGWICLMCCNADILFCVLVLHWVTSKEKRSSYTSTHASHNGTLDLEQNKRGPPMRQSMVAAPEKPGSRDKDAKDEIVEHTLERRQTDLLIWPYGQFPTSPVTAKLRASVTTEICSSHAHHAATRSKSKNGCVLHISRDDVSECGDEVELHKIHVQQEVCIDSGSSGEGEGERERERGFGRDMRIPSVEDGRKIKKSVSAEKMV